MCKRFAVALVLVVALSVFVRTAPVAQESGAPRINVTVDLVQLNVAVTDNKGKYVTGLHPEDFVIAEDGIAENIATFGEGNESARALAGAPASAGKPGDGSAASGDQQKDSGGRVSASELTSLVEGANVFVLFDTSNYMYRGFVFAQDAIADFVRSLESANKVAFYSYSRDLSRAALLTLAASQWFRAPPPRSPETMPRFTTAC